MALAAPPLTVPPPGPLPAAPRRTTLPVRLTRLTAKVVAPKAGVAVVGPPQIPTVRLSQSRQPASRAAQGVVRVEAFPAARVKVGQLSLPMLVRLGALTTFQCAILSPLAAPRRRSVLEGANEAMGGTA